MQTVIRAWGRGLGILAAGSLFLLAGCAQSMMADDKMMPKGEMTKDKGMEDQGMSADKDTMHDKEMKDPAMEKK